MTAIEEDLDRILDKWPEHNTNQEHEAIKAELLLVFAALSQQHEREIAKARLNELERLIDINSKQFMHWTQKDIAHFFEAVGARYRELQHQSNPSESATFKTITTDPADWSDSGFHIPSYQLAVEDFKQGFNALVEDLDIEEKSNGAGKAMKHLPYIEQERL